MSDDARLLDGGGDIAHSSHDGPSRKGLQEKLILLNSVLKGYDRCASFRQRDELWNCLLRIPEFDCEKDEVGVLNMSHPIDNLHLRQRNLA